MAEDRISEIIHNLDDHWGSPPILTPDTLAHILNHQWISNVPVDEQELENVISHNKTNMNKRVISDLIKELYKTIQGIDTKSEFEVTKDLKNDPVLQNFIAAKEQEEQPEDVLEHLVELLKYHNTTTTLNHGDP
ncbi:hypothetical protein INT47_003541 [Mucor saturninus]|uniref:Uncharacterized protein n=1 Tax=Mucor saturninus TaxID=64648 RepID=A0A8H7UXN0_9FUNG|nr:hypothetical protein INT47_003541 [Mucor saturninus]